MVGATFVTSDVGKAPCICMRRWRGIQYNTIQYSAGLYRVAWRLQHHHQYVHIATTRDGDTDESLTEVPASRGERTARTHRSQLRRRSLTHSLPIDDCNPGH